jgi:hypothetical protein
MKAGSAAVTPLQRRLSQHNKDSYAQEWVQLQAILIFQGPRRLSALS